MMRITPLTTLSTDDRGGQLGVIQGRVATRRPRPALFRMIFFADNADGALCEAETRREVRMDDQAVEAATERRFDAAFQGEFAELLAWRRDVRRFRPGASLRRRSISFSA